MQIFEVILYFIELILIIILLTKTETKKEKVIAALCFSFIVFILHVIFEPFRWQLLFLYVSWMILIPTILLRVIKQCFKKSFYKLLIITTMFFMFVSATMAFAFPVYDMPEVSGEYSIGTESFIIEDESRIEQYSNETSLYRKFKIQCWYPAETTEGYDAVPWLEDGLVVSRALSQDTGLPGFVLDHTSLIDSNSYKEAPIDSSELSYPVIVISHGWRGFRNLHTDFAEELASHGYFVVSIDHTYGSVATVFSDEEVAYVNLEALPSRENNPNFLTYANQLVNTYANDVIATIDFLELMNEPSSSYQFSSKLDLSKIGLLGHSTGGGGDVTVALQDDRIDAIIGLDAWVEPVSNDLIEVGLSIPALFLRSGQWETGENNVNLYNLIENNTDTSLLYQIDGTTHYDFTMVYMYSPLTKLIGFTGDVEGNQMNQILETMILEFYQEALLENEMTDLDTDNFEEVREIVDYTIED